MLTAQFAGTEAPASGAKKSLVQAFLALRKSEGSSRTVLAPQKWYTQKFHFAQNSATLMEKKKLNKDSYRRRFYY